MRRTFSEVEANAARRLIALALEEDLGTTGDLTCQAVLPVGLRGAARFVARKPGVVAGLPVAALVLNAVDTTLAFFPHVPDGERLTLSGTVLATAVGPMRSLLQAERTALNFLQRLSGVATLTRLYADAIAGLPCQILDTRKTTPGWRLLEKYAVRCGGGQNHRLGLYDGILIKDNHLAALDSNIQQALSAARAFVGTRLPVEIEVDTLAQLDEALAGKPDIVLLDNMSLDQLRDAVRRRNDAAPDVKLEASGGVTLETVRAIATTGVDRVSVGALTHSAPALDIALDYDTSGERGANAPLA